jgi:hypothetical protein
MKSREFFRRAAAVAAIAALSGCEQQSSTRAAARPAREWRTSRAARVAGGTNRFTPALDPTAPTDGLATTAAARSSASADAAELRAAGASLLIAGEELAPPAGDGDGGGGGGGAIEGSEEASIDDNLRFIPTTRPMQPEPQRPPLSKEENVDTNKPVHEWQRGTDDWFGARPWLDDRGVSFQANWTLDYSKNFRGGLDTAGSAFRHLFNANLTLNTERLFGLKGGTLFVNFQNQSGDSGLTLTGDAQMFSNIDADGRTQLSELWYEQALLDASGRSTRTASSRGWTTAASSSTRPWGAAPRSSRCPSTRTPPSVSTCSSISTIIGTSAQASSTARWPKEPAPARTPPRPPSARRPTSS